MTTIDFTLIPDAEAGYETIVRLISSFKRETGIDVNLKRMEWGDAWPQLISISTHTGTGRGYFARGFHVG